jgi:hypothetical protein
VRATLESSNNLSNNSKQFEIKQWNSRRYDILMVTSELGLGLENDFTFGIAMEICSLDGKLGIFGAADVNQRLKSFCLNSRWGVKSRAEIIQSYSVTYVVRNLMIYPQFCVGRREWQSNLGLERSFK